MGQSFSIQRGVTRVVFAAGASARIAEELDRLATRRVTVVCTPGRKAAGEELAAQPRRARRRRGRDRTPARADRDRRRGAPSVAKAGADAVLALGGGSAIGLAKAIALDADVRVIAVPTTYSGSEMTPIYGITAGRREADRARRAGPPAPRRLRSGADRRPAARGDDHQPVERDGPRGRGAVGGGRRSRGPAGRRGGAAPVAGAAARLVAGATTTSPPRARPRSRARTWRARSSPTPARASTTSCATCSAVCSTCPTRRLTRSSCPTSSASSARPRPSAMAAIARALGVIDPVLGMERLAVGTGAPRALERRSACRPAGSGARSTPRSRCRRWPGSLARA